MNFVSGFRLELMYISLIVSIRSSLQQLVLLSQFIGIPFLICTNRINLLIKVEFRQASNRCERVLEAAKLACANKIKESNTSQKLGSWEF